MPQDLLNIVECSHFQGGPEYGSEGRGWVTGKNVYHILAVFMVQII